MDICKIGWNLYQCIAIDDCTRYKMVGLFSKQTTHNTLLIIGKLIEVITFLTKRLQTDRGNKFFAFEVQKRLSEYAIRFRPIRPGAPHFNCKIEISQKTDLDEFYSTVDLKSEDLLKGLQEYQHYYN